MAAAAEEYDPRSVFEGLPQLDNLLDIQRTRKQLPLARLVFTAKCSSGLEDMRSAVLSHFDSSGSPLDFSGMLVSMGAGIVLGIVEACTVHLNGFVGSSLFSDVFEVAKVRHFVWSPIVLDILRCFAGDYHDGLSS